jgi:hypothetical protein|tara:strand:- start:627 stop:1163 length:537 start_codon:yes stop_codon:yes gene_type:complete
MAGNNISKQILNNTLLFIIQLFKKNNVENWFVAYGTLLGIIRENSCIDGDDDIDIIVCKNNFDNIKKLLLENGFEFDYGYNIGKSRSIIKTLYQEEKQFASIDFYMADIDENGNFHDLWENVLWTNCYDSEKKLLQYKWNNQIINIPFNPEEKLNGRYGNSWKTPSNSKGCMPRRRKI